jgi:hypothetical protein
VLTGLLVELAVNEVVVVADAVCALLVVVVAVVLVASGMRVAREAGSVDCPADKTAHADSTTCGLDLIMMRKVQVCPAEASELSQLTFTHPTMGPRKLVFPAPHQHDNYSQPKSKEGCLYIIKFTAHFS